MQSVTRVDSNLSFYDMIDSRNEKVCDSQLGAKNGLREIDVKSHGKSEDWKKSATKYKVL